jgi:predicted DNA-binding protein
MYTTYIMKRTQIYLDEVHDRALANRARAAGRTKSELIREAIGEFLAGDGGKDESLARFREALREASGVALHLPAGAEYVDRSRSGDERREQDLQKRRDRPA